jgi:hypothetical protein
MESPPCETCPIKCELNPWTQKACHTLTFLSTDATSFIEMVKQWTFTGEVSDFGGTDEWGRQIPMDQYPDCELCGQKYIRWGYIIKNASTGQQLMVGSKCILHFNITTEEELNKAAQRFRSKRKESKTLELVNRINKPKLAEYFGRHKAFTPKQVVFIYYESQRQGIPFNPIDFKIKLRKEVERDQALQYYDLIKGCLTHQQIEALENYREQKMRRTLKLKPVDRRTYR